MSTTSPRPVHATSGDGASPRLGDILVDRLAVTPEVLREALRRQRQDHRPLGELLMERGLDEVQLVEALAVLQHRTAVDLASVTPEEEALLSLDAQTVRRWEVLPFAIDGSGRLHVATARPDDPALLAALQPLVDREIVLELAGEHAVREKIDRHYTVLHRVEAAAERAVNEHHFVEPQRTAFGVAPDAPVVEIVDLLMTQALRDRASDIHIEPQEESLRIRYRIDGVLRDVQRLPRELGPPILSRIKIMADMDIVDRHRPQDGQVTVELEGRTIDIRVATIETVWGEKVALRLLDPARVVVHLSRLGLTAGDETTLRRLIAAPYGLVVVSGPTGSGKTTTLYAALNELDRDSANITTIEDPVEYQFDQINQIEINRLAGVSFANGLRAILRQDPDVVLVGEVRDVETAQLAVQAALTGHLVLCSVHASDAAGSLHRFLDMGIEPYLLASAGIGVIAQRLVRLSCNHCRVPADLHPEELAFYEKITGRRPQGDRTAGAGCNRCGGTGFRDRRGVFEVLQISDAVRQLIVDRATLAEVQRAAAAAGMRTLQQAGCEVADQDLTTLAEVMRRVYSI